MRKVHGATSFRITFQPQNVVVRCAKDQDELHEMRNVRSQTKKEMLMLKEGEGEGERAKKEEKNIYLTEKI